MDAVAGPYAVATVSILKLKMSGFDLRLPAAGTFVDGSVAMLVFSLLI